MNIKNIVYGILSVVLVIGLLIGFTFVSSGASDTSAEARCEYLKARTDEYKAIIRDYIRESPYENAGVTVTYVTEGDRARVYSVRLHHRIFESMSNEEKQELSANIAGLSFYDPDCTFEVIFD